MCFHIKALFPIVEINFQGDFMFSFNEEKCHLSYIILVPFHYVNPWPLFVSFICNFFVEYIPLNRLSHHILNDIANTLRLWYCKYHEVMISKITWLFLLLTTSHFSSSNIFWYPDHFLFSLKEQYLIAVGMEPLYFLVSQFLSCIDSFP